MEGKSMLDQLRQSAEDNMDTFQDFGQKMTRTRLIVILSGTAFALLFFLFMVGIFRKEESHLACAPEEKPIIQKPVASIEDRLDELLVRLERLENQSKATPLSKEEGIGALRQVTTAQDVSRVNDDPLSAIIAMAENDAAEGTQEAPLSMAPITSPKSQNTAKDTVKSRTTRNQTTHTKVHTVQKGETLSQISLLYYGTPNRWKAIYEVNRNHIGNINNLKVGTKLTIPQEPMK